MGARTKARKRALDILFEAEQRVVEARSVFLRIATETTSPLNPYVEELVDGVVAHCDRIDELIATYAEGWSLDRMPAVDRNLLRLAVFELLYVEDVPTQVAIDEAVSLAGDLSTDASPSFVNGVLGRIAGVAARITDAQE